MHDDEIRIDWAAIDKDIPYDLSDRERTIATKAWCDGYMRGLVRASGRTSMTVGELRRHLADQPDNAILVTNLGHTIQDTATEPSPDTPGLTVLLILG